MPRGSVSFKGFRFAWRCSEDPDVKRRTDIEQCDEGGRAHEPETFARDEPRPVQLRLTNRKLLEEADIEGSSPSNAGEQG